MLCTNHKTFISKKFSWFEFLFLLKNLFFIISFAFLTDYKYDFALSDLLMWFSLQSHCKKQNKKNSAAKDNKYVTC